MATAPGAVAPTEKLTRVPSAGIVIAAGARAELAKTVAELGAEIESLRATLKDEKHLKLLPDVEIFHKAVDWPLRYDEFYRSNEVGIARALLKQGLERVQQLRAGRMPWLAATGLEVRGYRSTIDGSVQIGRAHV